jgi:hypothetical protein
MAIQDPDSHRGQAVSDRMKPLRASLSLRIRLILFLGLLVLLATASLGSIAYRTSRDILVREAKDSSMTPILSRSIEKAVTARVGETIFQGCGPHILRLADDGVIVED